MASINEKLSYINDIKILLKKNINKINNVLTDNSTFRSYSQELFNGYLDILNNGTDTLWNNLEKVSASGEEATLENVETAPMKMVLSGNTIQETSILPDGYQQVEYIESNGNQYIDTGYLPNQDTKVETEYEITYLGSSGNGFVFGSRISSDSNNISATFDATEAYFGRANNYVKVSTTTSLNTKYLLEYSKNNIIRNSITLTSETANDFTSTLPMYIFCCNQNGNTLRYSRMKLYSFKIYDNNTLARDFIPCYRKSDNVIGLYDLVNGVFYTNLGTGNFTKGADAVLPNPDYPQQVKVVKGENVVSVSGKNLFDKDNATIIQGYFDYSHTSITSTSSNRTTYLKVKPNTTYSVSKLVSTRSWLGTTQEIPTINTQVSNISDFSGGNYTYDGITRVNVTITTGANDKYIVLNYTNTNSETGEIPATILNSIQIEQNSQATPYVPYSKTDYPINLGTLELCKIGDYQDYLYKNNGKWYVHKSVVRFPLLSSYGWYNSGTYAFKYKTSLGIVTPPSNNIVIDMFCNYFEKASTDALYNGNVDYGISISTDKGILIRNKDLSTSIADFKTYLDENNIYAYIPLAIPTEEEITNTTLISQLEAIYKAKSVKDKTYITQTNDELPFILDANAILKNVN